MKKGQAATGEREREREEREERERERAEAYTPSVQPIHMQRLHHLIQMGSLDDSTLKYQQRLPCICTAVCLHVVYPSNGVRAEEGSYCITGRTY